MKTSTNEASTWLRPLFIAVLGYGAMGSTCKTNVNPNDTTPPAIEIKVRGADGQYAPQTAMDTSVSTQSIELMCIVSDQGGVKSANLSFSVTWGACTVNSTPWTEPSAYFKFLPALPASMHQDLTGDSSGKVLNTLPLLATIKGPFTCEVPSPPIAPGEPKQGAPISATINVTCSGTNWSTNSAKDSAQKVLKITLH